MKVNLIKEAVYELNEEKSTKIPFDTFCKLSAVDGRYKSGNTYPKVRIFSSIDEFRECGKLDNLDNTKDVYVLQNGQFCAFLKEDDTTVTIEEKSENGTTDTKESTKSKA